MFGGYLSAYQQSSSECFYWGNDWFHGGGKIACKSVQERHLQYLRCSFFGIGFSDFLQTHILSIQILVASLTFFLGILIAFFPQKVIQLQIVAYRCVNWTAEPVSLEKEVRNTRLIGFLLILTGLTSLYLQFFH